MQDAAIDHYGNDNDVLHVQVIMISTLNSIIPNMRVT
jgi:hypothetical protein